jgi:DHA1 family bicyclomycin/chloramphenicol resistance-like MFS transporter
VLVVCRFGQAVGGAAGIVAARAIARDLRSGRALADLYAALMIVTGLTPVLAPLVGAQLMLLGSSWHTIFVAQAVFGVLIALLSIAVLGETLPADRRSRRGLRTTLQHFATLGRDRRFLLMVFAGSCGVATAFSFVSGSTFVLQDIYGLSAQQFSLNFALSSIGLMLASQASRLAPVQVRLSAGGVTMVAGSLMQVLAVATPLGVPGLVIGGFVMWCGFGALAPAAIAAAMTGHVDTAGSAAAVFGSVQFGVAGLAGPLVGIAGSRSAVPMVVMVTFWSVLALTCVVLARVHRPTEVGAHAAASGPDAC